MGVFGTRDTKHPLVAEMAGWGRRNISGPMRVISTGTAWDFRDLRRTPAEVREALESFGHDNVVAFQTRNPMHRAHEELVRRAIDAVDGVLLLHPSVGMTKPGDVDHYTRVRTYRALATFPSARDARCGNVSRARRSRRSWRRATRRNTARASASGSQASAAQANRRPRRSWSAAFSSTAARSRSSTATSSARIFPK